MKVTIEIPDQVIINCIDSADIGYWAGVPSGADTAEMLDNKAEAVIEEYGDEPDVVSIHTLTGKKICKALPIIAKRWPWHFKDILSDNSDVITGDVLIQVAIFGDIIYG